MLPTVSCLMVTCRPEMAKRSIGYYLKQDYPEKELVIVAESDDPDSGGLAGYVRGLGRSDIKFRRVPKGEMTLGALRNLTVDDADGDFVCSWDDDDLYHSQRISVQTTHLADGSHTACFLTDQLMWITASDSLYWCDWSRPHVKRFPPGIPNTMFCRRKSAPRYPEKGRFSRTSEDLVFMYANMLEGKTTFVGGVGYLYVYVVHGSNTWDTAHMMRITSQTALGAEDLCERRDVLASAMFDVGLPDATVVRDRTNAPALRDLLAHAASSPCT